MPTLNSKVALITGSARRIGRDIATLLHQHGMRIVLHYHTSAADAKALCAHFNQKRADSAIAIPADLLAINMLPSFVEQAIQAFGQLDVLVNNASTFDKTLLGKTNEAIWDNILDTNLKAPYFLSQAAAPYLAKTHGSIINIADIHAERPMRDYGVYSISKAGIAMLTKVLARELGPVIRVNSVSPGAIAWPEGDNIIPEDIQKKIIDQTALKRHGDPIEIAQAVLFLAQNADYITGQDIKVDGGRSLSL